MSRTARLARNIFPLLLLVAVFVPFASASGPYVIGSANTVSADPNVTRPSTTPCVVQLFSDAQFLRFQRGELHLHSARRLSWPLG